MTYLLAIAQHYGVPTRLLDWTRDPLVGMYFAASGGLRYKDDESRKIVIWATSETLLETLNPNELMVVRPPSFTNRNQRSQSGLFTTARGKLENLETIRLFKDLSKDSSTGVQPCGSTKAMLPASESPKVLQWLIDLRVVARIFPGFDGIPRTMELKAQCRAAIRDADKGESNAPIAE